MRELTPHYGADCPVAVVHRVSWPDERILRGTLADIRAQAKRAGITRTALILVGRALGAAAFVREPALRAGAQPRVPAAQARLSRRAQDFDCGSCSIRRTAG